MNREKYLLICLSEECSEIIQAVSKVLRFGPKDAKWGNKRSNIERVSDEVNDLLGVLELVQEIFPELKIDPEKIRAKKEKVGKYHKYSQNIGQAEK